MLFVVLIAWHFGPKHLSSSWTPWSFSLKWRRRSRREEASVADVCRRLWAVLGVVIVLSRFTRPLCSPRLRPPSALHCVAPVHARALDQSVRLQALKERTKASNYRCFNVSRALWTAAVCDAEREQSRVTMRNRCITWGRLCVGGWCVNCLPCRLRPAVAGPGRPPRCRVVSATLSQRPIKARAIQPPYDLTYQLAAFSL